MEIINLSEKNSILGNYIKEIRAVGIQEDPIRFRCNIERIGELMAYEVSKRFEYEIENVQTPLGIAPTNVVKDKLVVGSILRAGLAIHNGFLKLFDRAENAFVSAYRKYNDGSATEKDEQIVGLHQLHGHVKDLGFDIHVEYIASPSLNDKVLILADPMLATGNSMILAYKALLNKGIPKHIHIVSVIASQQAVDFISKKLPANCTIWCAAIDPHINEHSYIVPGLGDAGDLAFGEKM